MIIPADDPAYVPVGSNELMLLGEFSRTITIECCRCQCGIRLKLIADELLADEQCDEVLNAHLHDRGWRTGGDDTCPECAS